MGKDTVVVVQPQEPTVAEATEDRAPPIRASMDIVQTSPVVINSIEYQVLSSKGSGESRVRAYAARHDEFSDRDLPVHTGSDTTVIPEKEQQQALNIIASVSEPVAIKSATDDLPNQVADHESVGREAKEKALKDKERVRKEVQEDMNDPKLLDVLTRLLNRPDRKTFRFNPRDLEAIKENGKQCGGGNGGSNNTGKGSQTESSASQSGQGGFVTGCSGSSRLVVGGFGGGGLGGAGGGDDDPNKYNPFNNGLPSHYNDLVAFEEQPQNFEDAQRNAAMTILTQGTTLMVGQNPFLPQFGETREDPMSASLEGTGLVDLEQMDFDLSCMPCDPFLSDDPYLGTQDPMFQVAPAEETTSGVVQPMSQTASDNFPMREESEIKDSFDLIHLMKPQTTQRSHHQGQIIGITPSGGSIPRSQIPGLNLSIPCSPASPALSDVSSSSLAPMPSPCPPRTPATPGTPASMPATPQPRGFFMPRTYTDGDSRLCELSFGPDIPPEKRNTAIRAMFYINDFYASVFRCAEKEMDLKVANDVHAKMCPMTMDCTSQSLKVSLSMPKQCKNLSRWIAKNTDPKDRMLVLQQVLNTLATIHTLGYEDNLSLWGSFMVWVAPNLRVYILVDFPRLLQRQQECEMYGEGHVNPRNLDVAAVKDIYTKAVVPCIGRDCSWASPALRNVLCSFEYFLSDTHSACRMAEAARMLGEKRVCKIDVDMGVNAVFYCLEREELQTALRELSHMAPHSISPVWTVCSLHDGSYMRVGDIATADRPMKLRLDPCSNYRDTRLLYIFCN